jgi:hypothetical protein
MVYAAGIMSKTTFHYDQRRLENHLVVLEPFDVCVGQSIKAIL